MTMPRYAQDAIYNQGNSFSDLLPGLGGIFSGLFGNSDAPYRAAGEQYEKWGNEAKHAQEPFYNAGAGAIPQFQNWLQGMQDPAAFINHLMGNYSQSPWAQNQQRQAMRGAQNFGSATGLSGSTPLMLQAQQNSANIGSEDQNRWLQNVLGINTQYGAGTQNLMQGGQNSANALTDLYSNLGNNMGQAAYGERAGKSNDLFNLISGGLSLF